MRVIGAVLRLYAFLFNLAFGLALAALLVLEHSSGRSTLHLPVIPVEDVHYALMGGTAWVLLALGLALQKGAWARLPMLLWNIALPVVLAAGVARGGFTFDGPEQAKILGWLLLASLAALWGSWLQFRHKAKR